MSVKDFEERKAFLQLDDGDARFLSELGRLLAPTLQDRLDRFYDHLLAFEETRRHLLNEATFRRLQSAQSTYFARLFAGDFGPEYLADRIRVGAAHNRVGLSPAWYIGAYALYVRLLLPEIRSAVGDDAQRFEAAVESLLKPVFLDLGIAIDTYIAARDATAAAARTQAEASEKRFSDVVENASDGFVMMAPDNTVTYFNRRAEAMFGYDRSEVLGRSVTLLMPAAYVAAHEAGVRNFVETGAGKAMGKVRQVEGRRKDGTLFPIECTISSHLEAGEIVFTGVLRDVSERVRAEEEIRRTHAALERSEAGFRALTEGSTDAMSVIRDNRIVYLNAAAAALIGLDREAARGRSIAEFTFAEDMPSVEERLRAARETRKPAPLIERRIRRADGRVITCETYTVAIEFHGEPAFLSVMRDVTEKKRMQERLLVSDRMASVGTLAAGIAHEINNPLAYVLANLGFIDEEIRDPSGTKDVTELHNALADARAGGERVRQIVQELKAFSRGNEERKEAVDIGDVLESSLRIAMNEIRHRARLERRFTPVPRVLANAGRLGQVFLNLLVNAAQAIREGAADKNTIVVATGLDATGRIEVSISDSGEGIPAELLSRLFDPFFTTKPIGVGTGLGLSICHGIVSSMGGTIEVESAIGVGSTFRVLLPPLPAAVEDPAPAASATSTESSGPPLHILVIDDEPLLGASIVRLLSPHCVEVVTGVDEARNWFRANPAPDVVLCDLMMPVVTGMDFYADLIATGSKLAERMVFMTGGPFTPAAREFFQSNDCPKIEKPFTADALRRLVHEAAINAAGSRRR